MTYSKGDRVTLSNTSKFYNPNPDYTDHSNPINTQGKVVEVQSVDHPGVTLPITVNWDNGGSNAYSVKDLNIVRSSKGNKTLKKSDIHKLGMMMYYKGQVETWKNIGLDSKLEEALRKHMDELLTSLLDEKEG